MWFADLDLYDNLCNFPIQHELQCVDLLQEIFITFLSKINNRVIDHTKSIYFLKSTLYLYFSHQEGKLFESSTFRSTTISTSDDGRWQSALKKEVEPMGEEGEGRGEEGFHGCWCQMSNIAAVGAISLSTKK